MEYQIIYFSIISAFIFINIVIIRKDIQNHIISNNLLLGLIILFPGYFYLNYNAYVSELIIFILYVNIIFIISFFLSFFRIWGSGDSKYFIVLSLFTFPYGYFFLGANVIFVTILTMIGALAKNLLFQNKNGLYLGQLIFHDIQSKIGNVKQKYEKSKIEGSIFIINTLNILLLIFILFRTLRMLVLEYFLESRFIEFTGNLDIVYITFILIFVLFFLGRRYVQNISDYIKNKVQISENEFDSIRNIICSISLIPLLYIDYMKNPDLFFTDMYKLITLSFFLYIIIHVVIYIYKKCFLDMEKSIIKIDDLVDGDIVDPIFLKEYVSPILGYKPKNSENTSVLAPFLKKHYSQEEFIPIIHSFPFSLVLFTACIMTILIQDSPLFNIINTFKNVIIGD